MARSMTRAVGLGLGLSLVIYVVASVAGLWGPHGDPLIYWLRTEQRRRERVPIVLNQAMKALVTYWLERGHFPPDDRPYDSSAENLYHHLVVDLGLGYFDGEFVGAAKVGLVAGPSPYHRGRAVIVDPWGHPVQYRDPRHSVSAPLPDLHSPGRDGRLGTMDDVRSWSDERLLREWMGYLSAYGEHSPRGGPRPDVRKAPGP